MGSRRKHICSIESVQVFSKKDIDGSWIPQRFRKFEWITMRPCTRGAFKVKRNDMGDPNKHWKGRILEFCKRPNGVIELLVQHVYMHKDIKKHHQDETLKSKTNSKLVSGVAFE